MPYKDPDAKRAYQRQWLAGRRAMFLDGRVCVDCGAAENLEFDHVDPQQKVSHRIWTWPLSRIVEELAKCVVRCGPCHDERHARERRAPCGTASAYRRGCRCQPCRVAHRDDQRRRRLLRGATT